MRAAMAGAEVGDDVYGEDPTVNRLEALAAERFGMPAALFVTSGTQANLLALLSHCQRGDEFIAGQTAHAYRFEAGGAAVLGGIQPQPIPFASNGELPLDAICAAVKPDNVHFARTRLVCVENTYNGQPLSLEYLRAVAGLCDEQALALHMDGARVFNAAVALDASPRDVVRGCHSVSVCLSKGLGAPVGSLLIGDEALIGRARRYRKMLGGGMRQAGVIAAAGLWALEHNVHRLAEDHAHAARVAAALREVFGNSIRQATNMLFLDIAEQALARLLAHMRASGVHVHRERWVLHRDVSPDDVAQVVEAIRTFRDRS